MYIPTVCCFPPHVFKNTWSNPTKLIFSLVWTHAVNTRNFFDVFLLLLIILPHTRTVVCSQLESH